MEIILVVLNLSSVVLLLIMLVGKNLHPFISGIPTRTSYRGLKKIMRSWISRVVGQTLVEKGVDYYNENGNKSKQFLIWAGRAGGHKLIPELDKAEKIKQEDIETQAYLLSSSNYPNYLVSQGVGKIPHPESIMDDVVSNLQQSVTKESSICQKRILETTNVQSRAELRTSSETTMEGSIYIEVLETTNVQSRAKLRTSCRIFQ